MAFIDALAGAGLGTVDAGSFASPRWVPQMAGTAEVLARLRRRPGMSCPVLVPNTRGFEAGVDEIAVSGTASERFSRCNTNCSVAASLERFRPVCEAALSAGMRVRGYVSCVLGCPYVAGASGNVATEDLVYMLDGMGVRTGVDLGGLLAAGRLISEALGRAPNSKLALARGREAAKTVPA